MADPDERYFQARFMKKSDGSWVTYDTGVFYRLHELDHDFSERCDRGHIPIGAYELGGPEGPVIGMVTKKLTWYPRDYPDQQVV